jgi:6-phospho-3-hexuloisomerase
MSQGIHELTDQIAVEIQQTLSQVDEKSVLSLRGALLSGKRIFVTGRGRSGLQMKAAAMRLMHLGLQVYVIGDVTTPAITKGDLLLIGSGSGSTPSLVQYAEKAKSYGAEIALITTNANSVIAKMASYVITLPAPTPKVKEKRDFTSIQPMGSLFEQCLGILLDSIILQCMDRIDKSSDSMFSLHANLE